MVVQQTYLPYQVGNCLAQTPQPISQGFNFNYLFITSVCLLIVSHIVTAIYWAFMLRQETKVKKIKFFHKVLLKALQCVEGESNLKKLLRKYLPFMPASLPTLLFCRLAEVTATLEGDLLLERDLWEAMLQERVCLAWMANDVKIIGTYIHSLLNG